jgi:MFS family permease
LVGLQSLLLLAVILIEKVAQSGIQTAGAIVAFSLPAVVFGPVAGVILDRVSKKNILVVSSAARVVTQGLLTLVAFLGLERAIDPLLFVGLVYLTIFITSAIGQFFAPAEGSTIPLIVKREELFAANSLFTLTIVAIQVVALIIYVPISVKAFGIVGALASLAIFYLATTILLVFLPRDEVVHRLKKNGESAIQRGWREIGEGWRFTIAHRAILVAILQFSLVFTIVSVLGEIAPGYANRVLGLATEDAVFVFAPAGIGIVIASLFVVRFGQNLPRYVLPIAGMVAMGLGLIGMGALGLYGEHALRTQFHVLGVTLNATFLVGIAAPLVGIGIALVLIPAQTAVQEGATDAIRGRVLTVQLTLANAVSIPLLVAAGGLSDLFGIPQIVIALGALLFPVALVNRWYARRIPITTPSAALHSQPIPIAGESVAMVEETNELARSQARSNPAQ